MLGNAKRLRKTMTEVEKKIWFQLRAKRFSGYKFRRQVAIGKYVADFVCYHPKIVIELDGGQHNNQQFYDQKRDQFFKKEGFTVLRFWNNEVMHNIDGVLHIIFTTINTPLSNPLPQGERGLAGAL